MKETGGSTCILKGIVAHELMHALGIYHEQSRSDRDDYVTVNFENIETGFENNFNKEISASLLNTQYDIYSIMHYGSHVFSKNGEPTIVAKDPSIQLLEEIGRAHV